MNFHLHLYWIRDENVYIPLVSQDDLHQQYNQNQLDENLPKIIHSQKIED
jgi:hypothetical protein